ncbi:MAG: flagellar assembly protein FliW [Clostridiales bacterium]|nr:flagellar assembly protein FliW [Clostridiales bacterium]
MKAETRLFGEIDIEDEKIIWLPGGMIGFPHLQKFALIFDEEKEEKAKEGKGIMWLQSMDEPQVAFPVMHPNELKPDYNPTVNDEMLKPLGDLTDENIYILVTVTATKEIKDTSINLKAPIIINSDNRKGCQLIVEDDYPVKYKICEALEKSEKAGE